VFVEADASERERRARAARGWPAGEVARRESAQLPLAAKRARAGFVLRNDAGLEELERGAAAVLARIERERPQRTPLPPNRPGSGAGEPHP
jgi:dephospho-CoA kinase